MTFFLLIQNRVDLPLSLKTIGKTVSFLCGDIGIVSNHVSLKMLTFIGEEKEMHKYSIMVDYLDLEIVFSKPIKITNHSH